MRTGDRKNPTSTTPRGYLGRVLAYNEPAVVCERDDAA